MIKRIKQIIGNMSLMGIIILSACQNDPLDITGSNNEALENYIQANNISATKASEGYYFEAVQTNENGVAIESEDLVNIYYSITNLSGDVIDEHLQEDGDPVTLQYDVDAVIPIGIDNGLGNMREGETYRLYIPSSLAYQSVPSEEITTSEPIIAEIEVVEVFSEEEQKVTDNQIIEAYIAQENLNNVQTQSSGLRTRTLTQGNGNSPTDGVLVTIDYSVKFTDGPIFAEGTETVTLGESILIDGLEEGIKNMEYSEKAEFIIPSDLAYGASVRVLPQEIASSLVEGLIIPDYAEQVPPFTVLIFEVTLQQ